MSYLEKFHYFLKQKEGKPMIVFLHGLMGSWSNWRSILNDFSEDFSVFCYDQRGHGRSFHPSSGYAPEDYAKDLLKLLEELKVREPIFLVGHSMGGRNALNFSYQYPKHVRKLVLVDISPDSTKTAVLVPELLKKIPESFESRSEAKEFLLNQGKKLFPDVPLSFFIFLYTNIRSNDSGRVGWRFSKRGILETLKMNEGRWNEVKGLKVDTLLIRGKDSEDLSHSAYQRILSTNKKTKGYEIFNSGHWVHIDQPEEFTKKLREFFQSP